MSSSVQLQEDPRSKQSKAELAKNTFISVGYKKTAGPFCDSGIP